jgi:general secretion pathway protein E/type IV pilus assembly protein PilB
MNLGEILVRKGFLNEKELEEALQNQRVSQERVGAALVRLGLITEEQALEALSEQLAIPYVQLRDITPEPHLLEMLPSRVVFRNQIFPVHLVDGRLLVATTDPLNIRLFDELRTLVGREVEPVIASSRDIRTAISTYYGVGADTVDTLMRENGRKVDLLSTTDEALLSAGEDLSDTDERATLIRFVNQILIEALSLRATDVHLEPFEKELRVRYRVDGVLEEVNVPSEVKHFQNAIVSRIKIMAGLDIAEKRLPQDGRIRLNLGGREIDVRVSVIPMLFGEGVVLRLLDKASLFVSLEGLGMDEYTLTLFRSLILRPHGIILVTGPTGSGKTTTLYAALEKVRSPGLKIITIEDPIEYQLDGVNQIQVHPTIGLDFAEGLRRILRHDPNIIMVGEIRDRETAEIAIQAAMTGHLVFSTLHTNDSASALTRLVHMGIEPFLVASSVEGVMAQRLVRIICPQCREEDRPAEHVAEVRALTNRPDSQLWHGTGCQHCRNTGYYGRQGIFELVALDDKIRDMVLERVGSYQIKQYALGHGARSLRQAAWLKVDAGVTTLSELYRVTKEDTIATNGLPVVPDAASGGG